MPSATSQNDGCLQTSYQNSPFNLLMAPENGCVCQKETEQLAQQHLGKKTTFFRHCCPTLKSTLCHQKLFLLGSAWRIAQLGEEVTCIRTTNTPGVKAVTLKAFQKCKALFSQSYTTKLPPRAACHFDKLTGKTRSIIKSNADPRLQQSCLHAT